MLVFFCRFLPLSPAFTSFSSLTSIVSTSFEIIYHLSFILSRYSFVYFPLLLFISLRRLSYSLCRPCLPSFLPCLLLLLPDVCFWRVFFQCKLEVHGMAGRGLSRLDCRCVVLICHGRMQDFSHAAPLMTAFCLLL